MSLPCLLLLCVDVCAEAVQEWQRWRKGVPAAGEWHALPYSAGTSLQLPICVHTLKQAAVNNAPSMKSNGSSTVAGACMFLLPQRLPAWRVPE
jgi:hypothetical protein